MPIAMTKEEIDKIKIGQIVVGGITLFSAQIQSYQKYEELQDAYDLFSHLICHTKEVVLFRFVIV